MNATIATIVFFAVLALCYEVPFWVEVVRGTQQQKRRAATTTRSLYM